MLEVLKGELQSLGLSEAQIEEVIRRSQFKATLQAQVGQFVRQILALGEWQDGFSQVQLTVAIHEDEEGNLVGWAWAFSASHGKFGQIDFSGTVDLPQSQAQVQAQAQSQVQAQSQAKPSRSEWSRVLDLASRYGIQVKDYEKTKLSWYVGTILTRIVKSSPQAKSDPEVVALAQSWNSQKPENAPAAKLD
jgi:hypothetical protein